MILTMKWRNSWHYFCNSKWPAFYPKSSRKKTTIKKTQRRMTTNNGNIIKITINRSKSIQVLIRFKSKMYWAEIAAMTNEIATPFLLIWILFKLVLYIKSYILQVRNLYVYWYQIVDWYLPEWIIFKQELFEKRHDRQIFWIFLYFWKKLNE